MWFDVEPCDIGFTGSSPFRIENEAMINASPDRVFQILALGERQEEWFPDFIACRWTSPEPHRVGSTRDVELKMLTVKERFLVWEPGERLTFTITASTLPVLRRMMEDMRLERVGDRTRLRWTVHYAPAPLMRAVHPIAQAAFKKLFATGTSGLATYAGQHP